MKRINLVFGMEVNGAELKVVSFNKSIVDTDNKTCNYIEKVTTEKGKYTITMESVFEKDDDRAVCEILLNVIEYCREMWVGDTFIISTLRYIFEYLYLKNEVSLDEFNQVWYNFMCYSEYIGVNIIPYKSYGYQTSQEKVAFTSFIYVPVSNLHTPVIRDCKIVGYLELSRNGEINIKVTDEAYVTDDLNDTLKLQAI